MVRDAPVARFNNAMETIMTDDDDQPQKGNFIAFLDFNKKPDDDRPAFRGDITLPGTADKRSIALWPSVAKTGDTVLTGRAGESATAQIDKIADPDRVSDPDATIEIAQNGGKGLTIAPHGILLFTNKQKDKEHADRPDYWGYYNPGGGKKLTRIAAWARTDSRGKAMLSGSLQNDEPRIEREAAPSPVKKKRREMSM